MAKLDEEKILDFLLAFVDFLYAVIFGFVLQEAFSEVILNEEMAFSDKAGRLTLMLGVFYFLVSDWISARLLTLTNGYTGYRRFFIEILIAFCGYGAAVRGVEGDVSVLVYIALILFLGALWAFYTLREYPESGDRRELIVILVFQPGVALSALLTYGIWEPLTGGPKISFALVIVILAFGWIFELVYQIFAPAEFGLRGGPGVPFVRREIIDKIHRFFNTQP